MLSVLLLLLIYCIYLMCKINCHPFYILLLIGLISTISANRISLGLGADSATYHHLFENLNFDLMYLVYEPVFYIPMFIFGYFANFEIFAFCISIIVCLIYVRILKFKTLGIFSATYLPLLVFNTITNGVRIGLAMMIFSYFYASLNTRKAYFIAVLSHISFILLLPFHILYKSDKRRLIPVMFFIIFCILIASQFSSTLIQSVQSYIITKINVYEILVTPSIYSGLADIYILTLPFTILCVRGVVSKSSLKIYVATLVLALIIKIYFGELYFSLRILKLLSFISFFILCREIVQINNFRTRARMSYLAFFMFLPYTVNYIFDGLT